MKIRLVATLMLALSLSAAPALSQPKKDTVVLAMTLEPPGLDPTAGAASAIAEVTLYNIYETLTRIICKLRHILFTLVIRVNSSNTELILLKILTSLNITGSTTHLLQCTPNSNLLLLKYRSQLVQFFSNNLQFSSPLKF